MTWFLPEEDTYLQSEQKMKDEMVSLHGGRIAERIMFGQTTTGASARRPRDPECGATVPGRVKAPAQNSGKIQGTCRARRAWLGQWRDPR